VIRNTPILVQIFLLFYGAAELSDHRCEVARRLDGRDGFGRRRSFGLNVGIRIGRFRRSEDRLTLGVKHIREGDRRKGRVGHRNQRLGDRSGLDRSNNRCGKRRNHQQR